MYTLRLFNTLTRQEEEITPSDKKTIRMYTCGPTIYDFSHIGNFRTFLFEDVLRRTLELFNFPITQVMNLTDIDDKTIRGSMAKNVPLKQYTDTFKQAFFQDLEILRIERAEYYPEATNYIKQMIEMVQVLIDKGFAYTDPEGNVYFSISKFKDYGKLSHLDLSSLLGGASGRVAKDEYEKEGVADFVLWKAYSKERDGDVFWESPWGKGRPGWHLECSVMAKNILGETLDLHAGGVDLIFPHHENEIAQSESSTGKTFALHWAHAEHLLVDHKKMSKSLGNFYTLRDLLAKGFLPSSIRYFLIATHYRTQLNFTFQGIEGATASIKRIRDFYARLGNGTDGPASQEVQSLFETTKERFCSALAADLNISEALAALFDFIRHGNALLDEKSLSQPDILLMKKCMEKIDSVLAVLQPDESAMPQEIAELVHQREIARKEKNWKQSDTLRESLKQKGYLVEDTAQGQRISRCDIIHKT
jgi:cysteinyl-tRNA synthetase